MARRRSDRPRYGQEQLLYALKDGREEALELARENYGASVYYDVAAAYTDGVGTARDPEQAIYWWNRYLDTDDPKDTTRAKILDKIAALEAER